MAGKTPAGGLYVFARMSGDVAHAVCVRGVPVRRPKDRSQKYQSEKKEDSHCVGHKHTSCIHKRSPKLRWVILVRDFISMP